MDFGDLRLPTRDDGNAPRRRFTHKCRHHPGGGWYTRRGGFLSIQLAIGTVPAESVRADVITQRDIGAANHDDRDAAIAPCSQGGNGMRDGFRRVCYGRIEFDAFHTPFSRSCRSHAPEVPSESVSRTPGKLARSRLSSAMSTDLPAA